jgi:hypothetical protein
MPHLKEKAKLSFIPYSYYFLQKIAILVNIPSYFKFWKYAVTDHPSGQEVFFVRFKTFLNTLFWLLGTSVLK